MKYIFSGNGSGRPYLRKKPTGFCVEDNACVVMEGGNPVYACETERFSKIKHDYHRPSEALRAFKCYSNIEGASDVARFEMADVPFSHHENHIFESFYLSGFDEAAVLVNDGYGTEDDCITLAYMTKTAQPCILKKFNKSVSPCFAYATASTYIFGEEGCEGKLMGLSAYGSDNGKHYIQWDASLKNIHVDYPSIAQDALNYPKQDVMQFKDVAFTMQKNFEDTLVEVVKHFRELLDKEGIATKNLCMSGGGILNCPTNSRIIELNLFDSYYASPQPKDGCAESIGVYFHALHNAGESLSTYRLKTAFLGVTYPVKEVFYPHEIMSRPIEQLCDQLNQGGIIAWFQGGSEYGPRALGHRSFLADPTHKEMMDVLNKIKNREWWRPLAPIVPEELFSRIFEVNNADMCEFMLRTLKIKKKWQPRLQAVCHVDGTTRPQLLKRSDDPQLHALLMKHFEETGCPCLVNTSLNINGFPIVETPADLCDLSEEISFKKNIPEVKTIFVENNDFYEVFVPQVI